MIIPYNVCFWFYSSNVSTSDISMHSQQTYDLSILIPFILKGDLSEMSALTVLRQHW